MKNIWSKIAMPVLSVFLAGSMLGGCVGTNKAKFSRNGIFDCTPQTTSRGTNYSFDSLEEVESIKDRNNYIIGFRFNDLVSGEFVSLYHKRGTIYEDERGIPYRCKIQDTQSN